MCLDDNVFVYDEDNAYPGTTFFIYKYVVPDILYEVDMNCNIIWKLELSVKLIPDWDEYINKHTEF
jgi:hypothetical protein